MGRKGVSKRKRKQTKGRISTSNGLKVESQPGQVTEKSKASPQVSMKR